MKTIIAIIFALFFASLCLGNKLITTPSLKIWRPKIEFTNSSNWFEGNLPSICDRVVMPAMASVSVNLVSNLVLKELVLPLEGEIVLGEGSSLTFADQLEECKHSKVVQFIPPSPNSWYEPRSWTTSEEEKENQTIPIPEAERIPCQYDVVQFPSNTSYHASIGGPAIKVKSLVIDGQTLNASEFSLLERTASGKIRFSRTSSLDITNLTCSDETGCVCRDEDVTDLICQLTTCNQIDCSDPIKPFGGCCDLCGAYIIAEYKKDFELSRLRKLYETYISKDEYKNVYGYLSKISKNRIQVVFTDNLETHKASSLAVEVADVLKSDISGVGIYGITSIQLQISSHWLIYGRQVSGLPVGSIFGLSIFFICIVGLLLWAYVAFQKSGFAALSFGKLYEEKDEIDESDDEQVVTPFGPEATSEGIENPLYEKEKKKDLSSEVSESASADAESEKTATVVSTETKENPAFMVFEELIHLQ